MVSEIWHRALSTQPAPADAVIAAAAIVALAAVVVPGLWRSSRHLVTMAHEAAHAVVAVISGRRLSGIRLHADTSGLTLSRGRSSGLGMVATAAAGYVGPAALGLGAAYLLKIHHAVALLWLVLVVLVGLLVMIRNWFGVVLVLVAGLGVFAVSWWGSGRVQSGFAYAGAWFLLLAAPRPVLELQAARHRRQAGNSDADVLARLTKIPGLVWVGFFLVVTVALAGLGGSWLVGANR